MNGFERRDAGRAAALLHERLDADYVVPVLEGGTPGVVLDDRFFDNLAVYSGSNAVRIAPFPYLGISGAVAGRLDYGDPWQMEPQPPARVTTDAEALLDAVMDRLYGQHCGRAVVKCQHCGQWAARYCACKHCGAPVD
jgi:hypothetical protein